MKKTLLGLMLIIAISSAYFISENKNNDYSITTQDKTILVSKDEWRKVEDSDSYAKNFEAMEKTPNEEYSQVITIFLNSMTSDRMVGEKISENEYLEMFVVHPDTVTVQIRNDKDEYWILSRQTFSTVGFRLDNLNPEDNFDLYKAAFQNDIDNTRFVIGSEF
jgi:hypothetical protein